MGADANPTAALAPQIAAAWIVDLLVLPSRVDPASTSTPNNRATGAVVGIVWTASPIARPLSPSNKPLRRRCHAAKPGHRIAKDKAVNIALMFRLKSVKVYSSGPKTRYEKEAPAPARAPKKLSV